MRGRECGCGGVGLGSCLHREGLGMLIKSVVMRIGCFERTYYWDIPVLKEDGVVGLINGQSMAMGIPTECCARTHTGIPKQNHRAAIPRARREIYAGSSKAGADIRVDGG